LVHVDGHQGAVWAAEAGAYELERLAYQLGEQAPPADTHHRQKPCGFIE
jgi:hypothetical protein